jgi:hypothetical protein
MTFFVLSQKSCGKCGGGGGVQPKGFLQFTRPFTHNHNYYYKPHSQIGGVGSFGSRAIWRKQYYKT